MWAGFKFFIRNFILSDYYKPSGFGGFSFFPPVIKNLMIINGIVFLFTMLGQQISLANGYTFNDVLTRYFALIPLQGMTVNTGYGLSHWSFYPWQLITYQFMHGGFMHIFFNMFALWMFGMEVENLWGSKKFLTFYLMCGIVASYSFPVMPFRLNTTVLTESKLEIGTLVVSWAIIKST